MTDRSAIETPDAENHRIEAAFARNPVIRYRIPYPNGQSFVLKLMDADAPGSSAYPSVQGAKEDGRWNPAAAAILHVYTGLDLPESEVFHRTAAQRGEGRADRQERFCTSGESREI